MLRGKSQVGFGFFLLVLFSCTIIKDSDVTSINQLNSLTLKSFEIVQNSKAGNSSALASLKYDSAVSRTSAGTGAHVSRVRAYALPALGNYKMKLKSGTNAATEIAIGYKDNGMPNALTISKGDSTVEFYRFYYNSSNPNQLIKFVVDINPVDNLPELLHIKDTIIYPAGNVYPSSIIRKSSDAALAGTFTMQTCQGCTGSSSQTTISEISFNQQPTFGFNGSNCNNSDDFYPYSCGGVSRNNSQQGSNGANNIFPHFQNNFTFNKTIQTFLTSASNTDTYYFHPIMILKDVVTKGDFYFWFYSIDWYQTTGNNAPNDDQVNINFNYGH